MEPITRVRHEPSYDRVAHPRVDRDQGDEGEQGDQQSEERHRERDRHAGVHVQAAQRPVSTDSASTTCVSASGSGARPDSGPSSTRSMPSVGPART